MPWMTPEHAVIARDFDPSDLRPLLDACGIDRTILVQSACTDRDTDAMLTQAAEHDWIAAVTAGSISSHRSRRRPGSACWRGSRRCEGFAI
jgi:Predicted metal-dependent hydrolase of the TIM-barrel fold